MKALTILFAAGALAACVPGVRAQQTKLLTAEKHNEYGLVYSLPRTALEIEVTAERQVLTAGPYWQYAKKYVGTDKVVRDNAEIWDVKSVTVRPYGVQDPGSRYLMQLKPGAVTYIGVAADGMLLSVNANPEEPAASGPLPATVTEGEVLEDNEYLQYVDGDFIASQSMAKQAQMLAESLMEIRDAKIALTRGTADQMPADGKQLELMLNSLAHQERAVTAAFTGNTVRQTVTRRYTYVPGEEGRETLFRMSGFDGFVSADDYSGEPVYISVEVTNRGALPTDARGEVKKVPKDALAYCVPGSAKVTLSTKGNTLYQGEFEMAQYGVVFGLSPTLFSDRKAPSYAIFDPATGALKELGAMRQEEEQ